MMRQSLLLLVLLTTPPFLEATETFSFQSYQQGMLRMILISPSLDGEAQLRHDKKLEVLTGVMMENLFTMRTEVPCQWLKADSVLYWYLPGRCSRLKSLLNHLKVNYLPHHHCRQPSRVAWMAVWLRALAVLAGNNER